MTYRKRQIPIRVKDHVEYRSGYTFDACFSDGTLFEVGVFKAAKDQWLVSDLNTGLAVCYGRTRVDAVKQFQQTYLSKLERLVMSIELYSSSPSCRENYYWHMASEFDALKGGK